MTNKTFFKIVSGLVVFNGLYFVALAFIYSELSVGLMGIGFIIPGILVAYRYVR